MDTTDSIMGPLAPRGFSRQERRRLVARYDGEAAQAEQDRQADARRRADARDAATSAADAEAPCDIDALTAGDLVRDRFGWHRVVRVSKKTVTVKTPFSWTERIARQAILETRAAAS